MAQGPSKRPTVCVFASRTTSSKNHGPNPDSEEQGM